jgi:FAD/FMN-containing dehydrogenase
MTALEDLTRTFSGRIITDPAEAEPFLVDWRQQWRGSSRAVLQPETVDDVVAAVRWCQRHSIPIVPQGGNTGLSGGATPDASGDAVLISLARMNRIRSIDLANDTMAVDAGCLLATVQEAAARAGRLFPLSLAAEGSCTIGGNLATNAGGTSVLRYGNMRDLCLGVEVVTAEGEVWNGLRGLRKDNAGIDLRDLYIGSEGTLGIITGAIVRLFPQPAARVVAFAGVPSPTAAIEILRLARGMLGADLTAFEIVSRAALDLVFEHLPGRKRPLETNPDWYLLIENTDHQSEDLAREKLEGLLAKAFDSGFTEDAVIGTSMEQSRALWSLREGVGEAQAKAGKAIKHDIAVPISSIAGFLSEADAQIAKRWPSARLITFGHIGDGNLHYNLSPPRGEDGSTLAGELDAINGAVHDIVVRHGGTISAEHGLGQLRAAEAARYKSPVELALMRRIKDALDPKGLMNPGKVFA